MKKKYIVILIILIILSAIGVSILILSNKSGNSILSKAEATPTPTTAQTNVVPSPTSVPKPPPPTTAPLNPPLALTVTEPKNGSIVSTARVTIKGTTVPQAEVFIDDAQIAADAKGSFTTSVTLEEGENYILVSANDENGSSAEQEITVTYTPK